VPGSYLALSNITSPGQNADAAEAAADVYKARATSPAILRSPKEIKALFDGYGLVETGLVNLPQWRPSALAGARDAESV
jgi:hypothetical protein